MVGTRARDGVEIARKDHWITTDRVSEPFWAQKGIDLRQPLVAAQAEMGIDDLHLDTAHVHRHPESAPGLEARAPRKARKRPGLDEPGGPMGQDGIAILLLQHAQ